MIPDVLEPVQIAEVLGGQETLGRPVRSLYELSDVVEHGLPKRALKATASHVYDDAASQREFMYRVVPEATYKRRRERLSPAESERTERLARVVALAEFVWDEPRAAREFLTRAHPLLRRRAPIDVALTEIGARMVEQLLVKVFHGLPV